MKDFYLARIAEAQSLDELNYILEQASDSIQDDATFEEVYNAALAQVAIWRRIKHENDFDGKF